MSTKWPRFHTGVGYALLADGLVGASTPFAKTLVGQVSPLLAGLLSASARTDGAQQPALSRSAPTATALSRGRASGASQ